MIPEWSMKVRCNSESQILWAYVPIWYYEHTFSTLYDILLTSYYTCIFTFSTHPHYTSHHTLPPLLHFTLRLYLGGVHALIQLSSTDDQLVKKSCASAFYHLSTRESNRANLVNLGAVTGVIAIAMQVQLLHHWLLRYLCHPFTTLAPPFKLRYHLLAIPGSLPLRCRYYDDILDTQWHRASTSL